LRYFPDERLPKTPIQAADDLVGKSILCPHCDLATTVANGAGVTTADVVEAAEQA